MSQQPNFPSNRYSFPLGGLPAGASTSTNMSGFSANQGTGMRGLGQYTSTPGRSQGFAAIPAHSQTPGGGRGFQNVSGDPGYNMLHNFFNDPAGPWNPFMKRPAGQPLHHPQGSSFTTYRNVRPPSEAETTTQPDSGYVTMPAMGPGSHYGDTDRPLPDSSILPRFMRVLGPSTGQESIVSNDDIRRHQMQFPRPASTASVTKSFICQTCNQVLKRNSELKKHQARHDKPFRCDIPGCSRTEGFSTSNDLDRHKKCVHKVRAQTDPIYRCPFCKGKDKDWPRADNFKAHLKRVHKDVHVDNLDLSEFLRGPPHRQGGIAAANIAAAQAPWIAEPRPSHVSPAQVMNTEPRFDSSSHLASYESQFSGENNVPTAASASVVAPGESQPTSYILNGIGPGISDLGLSQSFSRHANLSEIHDDLAMEASDCVAPDVLTQVPEPQPAPFSAEAQTPSPDVGHGAIVQPPETRSEPRRAGSTIAGRMEVDEAAEGSSSNGGDDEDGNSEADGPEVAADTRPSFARDADAELLGTGQGQEDFKEPREEQPMGEDSPQSIELLDDDPDVRTVSALLKRGKLAWILKKLGFHIPEEAEAGAGDQKPSVNSPVDQQLPDPPADEKPADNPSSDQKPPGGSSAVSDSGRAHVCDEPKCGKSFLRNSELKKHKRRHYKPYACTFPSCDNRFGSKSDWKRHENNQHVQHPLWLCGEELSKGPEEHNTCDAVFYTWEKLKQHVMDKHHITDPAILDKKNAACRMGRNFESRFWCGFCRKVIEPTGNNGPAHSERFDHIDNHFNGRNMPVADIKDWKHLDEPSKIPPGQQPLNLPGTARDKSGNGQLKRAHPENGNPGHSKPKRRKGESMWICCDCGDAWGTHTTPACSCGHMRCGECDLLTV